MSAYAVIKTGGKQYRVAENDFIVVEKLAGETGEEVTFDEVVMLVDGDATAIGAPLVAKARVTAEIAEQRRAPKIRIVKKKARTNDRKVMGHRQHETVLKITGVFADGGAAKPKKAKAETPKPAPEPAADAEPALKFLDAPEGDADDLKKISGVGPKLEEKLNALGIYHFAQVAAFTDAEIARIDEVLNFKGRIERDNWREQAAALARGEDPAAAKQDGADDTDEEA